MLFHLSIDADDPHKVASVIAEIWGGKALPFPPFAGSWMAMAGDARGTQVEVYPRGTEIIEVFGDADATGIQGNKDRHSATHFAMGTDLDIAAVRAIAAREGWPAKYRRRGGLFGVIEMWVEGCRMVEVLTPDMQAEYLGALTIENWEAMLAGGPQPVAA